MVKSSNPALISLISLNGSLCEKIIIAYYFTILAIFYLLAYFK